MFPYLLFWPLFERFWYIFFFRTIMNNVCEWNFLTIRIMNRLKNTMTWWKAYEKMFTSNSSVCVRLNDLILVLSSGLTAVERSYNNQKDRLDIDVSVPFMFEVVQEAYRSTIWLNTYHSIFRLDSMLAISIPKSAKLSKKLQRMENSIILKWFQQIAQFYLFSKHIFSLDILHICFFFLISHTLNIV